MDKKVIVITGAGGVLCGGFAKELAADGHKIALLDINLEAASEIAEEINANGGEAIALKTDVLSRESIEKSHEEVLKKFGKCDILINGAGGNNPKGTTTKEYFEQGDIENKEVVSFFDLDPQGVGFVFNLNFLGTLLPTQVFAQDFTANEKGCILNISSMNAYTPLTKIPAYSGAKAAISNFTQWLAVHFAGTGIRVNAIAPGFFVTKQNEKLLFNDDGTPTQRTGKILAATPMGRFGDAKELMGAVRFLLDDEASSFVTGVVIPIDGGFSAYSGV
ncbi:MAG: SDR family oxidoreductase [Clostridia bacterium]|nr:SDR family oxidoreductase [Clostridia bacterium]